VLNMRLSLAAKDDSRCDEKRGGSVHTMTQLSDLVLELRSRAIHGIAHERLEAKDHEEATRAVDPHSPYFQEMMGSTQGLLFGNQLAQFAHQPLFLVKRARFASEPLNLGENR
jgi:uncharacterized lipoprotein YehR (DUF1307 family)